ncbi:hypothetical protein [Streptomyces katsurahamanus]|uniref:hypothetical protein n=1 Tax=Streptomyces katsurahamanus TaxID=2577098 RepID=UPI0018865F79|nr:hypothetical protein [Streptomyces katsurahamanus]
MSTSLKRVLGIALAAAGVVLLVAFPDTRFIWFEGKPVGIALILFGGLEFLESYRRTKPRGIVEELRSDFGLKSSEERRRDEDRRRYDDRDRDRDQYDDRDRDEDRRRYDDRGRDDDRRRYDDRGRDEDRRRDEDGRQRWDLRDD